MRTTFYNPISLSGLKIKKGNEYLLVALQICGAAGSRTLVQTYPLQAFYMFIQLLVFVKQPEPDQPTVTLDE